MAKKERKKVYLEANLNSQLDKGREANEQRNTQLVVKVHKEVDCLLATVVDAFIIFKC